MLEKAGRGLLYPFSRIDYAMSLVLKKMGIKRPQGWAVSRNFIQIVAFAGLVLIANPHTKQPLQKNPTVLGQKSIIYTISGGEEIEVEEVFAEIMADTQPVPSWRQGSVQSENDSAGLFLSGVPSRLELSRQSAAGTAFTKPTILPGVQLPGLRTTIVEYEVAPGDSLGSIASDFGVSLATIIWENKLTTRSIIRPGDKLKILPVTGIMHTIKKGDTLKKIALAYQATADAVVRFNKLDEDGTDLIIGERLVIPDGVLVGTPAPRPSNQRIAAPPGSRQTPGASGFIWPSGARTITQYFGLFHHAVDIAGPLATATYAAKAGTVEKAQCGWNNGYGCYIIIDHGGGVKTLYGHHSRLLVSPGDHIEAGQTIALMGNTGKVRGVTGIHLHFEVIVNGVRVNPLGYVR